MQKCTPTRTPEIDDEALRTKYLLERDKRIRPEGQQQYLVAEGEFEEYYESDPYTPVEPRPPISEDIDVAVLGGGLSGLLAAARVKQTGVSSLRVIEQAGDFGGAWYWNRYPGIQCDWTAPATSRCWKKSATSPSRSTRRGTRSSSTAAAWRKHFGLYDNAIFSTLIRSMTMGRGDQALADRHQPGRRDPGPLRRDVPGAVQPAEAAWNPRDHGLSGAHRSTRRAGTTTTPAATSTAAWTGSPASGSPSSAQVPAASRSSRISLAPPSTCTCSSGRRPTSTSAATCRPIPSGRRH